MEYKMDLRYPKHHIQAIHHYICEIIFFGPLYLFAAATSLMEVG